MDARDINYRIVAIYKVLFFVIGTIGNFLFIHLIVRRKQLQSRTSILQCFQCSFHFFCQVGTISTGVFQITNTLNRSECFHRVAFYVFFQAAQGLIMVIIVMDILVLVKFPMHYLGLSSTQYIIYTALPVLLFSALTTYYGYVSQDDEAIPVCGPPFVFTTAGGVAYKYIFIGFSITVTLLYIFIINFFRKKNNQTYNEHSLKTMKRLQVSVVIYVLTWLFSQVFGLIVLKINVYTSWTGIVAAHNNLFVCLSYSNTFYVTMWRCKEYRDQFYSLWRFNRKRSGSVAVLHTSFSLPKIQSLNAIANF